MAGLPSKYLVWTWVCDNVALVVFWARLWHTMTLVIPNPQLSIDTTCSNFQLITFNCHWILVRRWPFTTRRNITVSWKSALSMSIVNLSSPAKYLSYLECLSRLKVILWEPGHPSCQATFCYCQFIFGKCLLCSRFSWKKTIRQT